MTDAIAYIKKHRVSYKNGTVVNSKLLYDYKNGVWTSKISVVNNKIVQESNHFALKTDPKQELGNYEDKRKPSYIFSRIKKNHQTILSTTPTVTIDDNVVCLCNAFSTSNAGHDLFSIFNILIKYRETSVKFIVFEEQLQTNNFKLILLLIPKERLIVIRSNVVYNLSKEIIENEEISRWSNKYYTIVDLLNKNICETMGNRYSLEKLEQFQGRKVIIIKNTRMQQVVRPADAVNAEVLFQYLEKEGWYIINPETDELFEFAYVLLHAQLIVSGERGISCANQFFYNPKAEIIPFIVSGNELKIVSGNKTRYNIMCNFSYFERIKRSILSPKVIKSPITNFLQM